MCIRDRRLPVDKLIQRLSWIYDINFKASARYIAKQGIFPKLMKHLSRNVSVSYTHLRAHETVLDLVCRLLLEKKKTKTQQKKKQQQQKKKT